MDQVGDIIQNVMPEKKQDDKVMRLKHVKCVNCGNIVTFKPKQFRQYCTKCGLSIAIWQKEKNEKDINCWICKDTGIVIYTAQIEGQIAEFAARCLCPAGADKGDRIPVISECLNAPPIELIKYRNKKEYEKRV